VDKSDQKPRPTMKGESFVKKELLLSALNKGLDEVKSLMDGEYEHYPPIVNSSDMLEDIKKKLEFEKYLVDNKARLNVGLLAAKALDFDKDVAIQ
jgi:hypothetical protein